MCQVTSKPYGDPRAVVIEDASFAEGALHCTSYARPGKLFTGNRDLMVGYAGRLKPEGAGQIVDAVVALLRASPVR